ncbi:serine/threonine-protein kinase prpf4B-like isoform X1 [Senna tora]|uniref:non-specific serine/threonine protein kinase n=1 Tax=Senna tora TaxID=362788 RepID=A0A834U1H3_9FABA|nr:serine/threonine-protein kinase prpf4B-like isoform X1 [Senna tora]
MASDAHGSRRKHRRSSSPEEVEKSSKRHKHRHHSHRHHRHRHGSKRREEELELDAETVDKVPSPVIAPNFGPNSRGPDDDVEEGEILEEDGVGGQGGEIAKKQMESDAESGEIIAAGERGIRSDKANLVPPREEALLQHEDAVSFRETVGINAKSSITNNEGISNGKFRSPALDGEGETCHQRQSSYSIHDGDGSPTHSRAEPPDGKFARANTDGLGNGYSDYKSSKGDEWQHREFESFKGNEMLKGEYDNEDLEVNGGKVNIHKKNSSSESGGGKYRTSGCSPNYRYRSPSRSSGHTHSIIEEYAHSKGRNLDEHGAVSYAGRQKTDYSLDEERMMERGRERRHASRDLVVDDRRERSSSIYSREAYDRDRSRDMDVRREKERERGRNREADHGHRREKERERSHERDRREKERERSHERDRREKERERSHERDRRDVVKDRSRGREVDRDRRREKERDRSWDTVVERSRREKERERSRDRARGGERDRPRESERNDKNRERDKIRERERRDDRNRHKDRDTLDRDKHLGYEDGDDSRDRYRYSRHSRHEDLDNQREGKRNSEPVKVDNSMETSLEGGYNLERGDDQQDDLDEKVTLQFDEQEEEDLNRIKEESRRRREAILEKYKKQQQHLQAEKSPENEEKDKDPVDIPAAVSEAPDAKNDGVDASDAEPSFSVGKSPPQNGNAASEKIPAVSRGLGEGSPKSEGSDDQFCDDIFGETPTGVRKSGKGDGLRLERGGLYDNWDDAEGISRESVQAPCQCDVEGYRFGEILDGRYEVTAAHGRGVFSTVVRAKNLRAGNGEPEEVAIKIIRNNDTMYKAGLDELVILKKLVGADPDDKRHCVRFLSSFKYRNHLCLVFESLHMNLREVLKKFGRNIGLRLTAVRAYAKQLFIALKHLRNCGVLHCDIKPDNMLVNEAKNVLKLCDFGNAMFAGKNEVTPYLVSRFYRAPEIILGLPYDHPLDMWSVGCCLYELYTGKVLFPDQTLSISIFGETNLGAFIEQHFDQDLNFLATEEDPVTKKTIKRMIVNIKPKDIGSVITGSPGEDPKMLANFKDLLEKVFVLDPDKSCLHLIHGLAILEAFPLEVFGCILEANSYLIGYSTFGPAVFSRIVKKLTNIAMHFVSIVETANKMLK